MFKNLLTAFMEPVNLTFTILMVLLFIFGLLKRKRENDNTASIISALGMLGTFVGIFIGLMNFDQGDLEASVPQLLIGMKTAFITSITGLILSNILKFIKSQYARKDEEAYGGKHKPKTAEEAAELMASYMRDVKDSIISSNESFKESSISIKNDQKAMNDHLLESLVGQNERSLTTNIATLKQSMLQAQTAAQESLLRGLNQMSAQMSSLVTSNNSISAEIAKGNSQLITEFRAFAKQMAENNMKAFTDAIQSCIKDLNNQLQDQFGDNFKHLNEAVMKLLQWQENYKATIEYTTTLQKNIFQSIGNVGAVLKDIGTSTASISDVAKKLNDKTSSLNNQEISLAKSVSIMNKVSDESVQLIPKINTYIEKVNGTLNEICNGLYKMTQTASQGMKTQQEQILTSFKDMSEKMNLIGNKNLASIKGQIDSISKASYKLENDGLYITKMVTENIRNMIEENNKNLQDSVKMLNSQLASTLNTSLESLGNQLAAVSEKFVKDYTPLTESLQRLVEIAKR